METIYLGANTNIDHLRQRDIPTGARILLERGRIYEGLFDVPVGGVSLGAYGDLEKPRPIWRNRTTPDDEGRLRAVSCPRDGLTVTGIRFEDVLYAAVEVFETHRDVSITDCEVGPGVGVGFSFKCSRVRVTGCRFEDMNVMVSDVPVYGYGAQPIAIRPLRGHPVRDFLIQDCTFDNCKAPSDYMFRGMDGEIALKADADIEQVVFADCIIRDCAKAFEFGGTAGGGVMIRDFTARNVQVINCQSQLLYVNPPGEDFEVGLENITFDRISFYEDQVDDLSPVYLAGDQGLNKVQLRFTDSAFHLAGETRFSKDALKMSHCLFNRNPHIPLFGEGNQIGVEIGYANPPHDLSLQPVSPAIGAAADGGDVGAIPYRGGQQPHVFDVHLELDMRITLMPIQEEDNTIKEDK